MPRLKMWIGEGAVEADADGARMTRDVKRWVGKYVVKVDDERSKVAEQATSWKASDLGIETEK